MVEVALAMAVTAALLLFPQPIPMVLFAGWMMLYFGINAARKPPVGPSKPT